LCDALVIGGDVRLWLRVAKGGLARLKSFL
jgi:hypothetical protein